MQLVIHRGERRELIVDERLPGTRDRRPFQPTERFRQSHLNPGAEIRGRLDPALGRRCFETVGMRERPDRKQAVAQMQQDDEMVGHRES